MAKEPWRQLITSQSPVRALSPEWIDKEPELKDFDLEGKDLNLIYRDRKRLEDNKQMRINALEKTRPENPGKTKAPAAATLFIAGALTAIIYGVTAKFVNWLILGALIAESLLALAYIWHKISKIEKEYRTADMAVSDQIHAVKMEKSEYEDDYQNLKKYCRAVFDHDCWKKRKNPEFWKGAGMDEAANHLVSMYRTAGIESAPSSENNLSLTYENSNGKDCGFLLNMKSPLTVRNVNNYLEALYMEGCKPGVIACFKGIQKDAAVKCEEEVIQVWTVEDIVQFAEEIEEEYM